MEVEPIQEATVLQLPQEILEKIFACGALQVRDLCHLNRTCSLFKDVIESNSLWRTKFLQSFGPSGDTCLNLYHEVIKKKSQRNNATDVSWRAVTTQRIVVMHRVVSHLDEMASSSQKNMIQYQRAVDEGQFYSVRHLLTPVVDTDLQLVFIVDELQRILHRGSKQQNLTRKYFAEKALWHFHHRLLLPEVESFVAGGSRELDIERGATLIARWFQPRLTFTEEDIKHQLDELADVTKEALRSINADHPVLTSQISVTVNEKSLWSSEHCRQIILALEMVVKPSFNRNFESYYKPTNSFINIVLSQKEGIPITLCLTVLCVGRRLGLVLEPVNFPYHFILRWMEFPLKLSMDRYSFMDVFGGRYFLKFQDLVECFSQQNTPILESHCNKCTHREVLHRMLRNLLNLGGHQRVENGLNLLRHSVELATIFLPQDTELAILSAQVSLNLKVNIPQALRRIKEAVNADIVQRQMLAELQDQCERLLSHLSNKKEQETPTRQARKRRENNQVMFAVGMVMQHKKYKYLCVIRGWDEVCQASEQWIQQMNVDKCQHGRSQPFYNVWVMDGSDRYAAEENLIMTKETGPALIQHPEVGRLFTEFTGRYYIPGPQLIADYPDDLRITQELVTRFFEENV